MKQRYEITSKNHNIFLVFIELMNLNQLLCLILGSIQ